MKKIDIKYDPNDFDGVKNIRIDTSTLNSYVGNIFENVPIKYDIWSSSSILGEGSFAKVYSGTLNNNEVAIKQYNKSWMTNVEIEMANNEINIHKKLNHPNIIKFITNNEDDKNINIILEKGYADLNSKLYNDILSENNAKKITIQCLNSLNYLHQNNIIHGDINPKNILLTKNHADQNNQNKNDYIIKICDFGLSRIFDPNRIISLKGTFKYIAPELVNKESDTCKVDMWSLGIMLYKILCGYYPFTNCETACHKKLEFHNKYWHKKSEDCIDFIRCLLEKKVENRMDAFQALNHKWIIN